MSSPTRRLTLALLPASAADKPAAENLAVQIGAVLLPAGTESPGPDECDAVLRVSGDELSLQQTRGGAPGPVRVDFDNAAMRHRRRSSHNELVGRAVGIGRKRQLRLLDATAGLGRDSFVLADLGCEVTLCERDAVIAAMLSWGLRAAASRVDPWLTGVVARMQLLSVDARCVAAEVLQAVDVIYLDPMFPQREKSAAVKKEMALFQLLLDSREGQADGDELLLWALQQEVARVVVKRPSRAACLAGRQPSHSISGKAVRYDVYVLRGLT